MAEKRMFTQKIIDSDAFLDMPLSAQALYFHLNMRADDDGFVNNPKRITKLVNASEDDLKILLIKRFIIGFASGVIVIKHWRMHNTLKSDRYKPTQYQEELAMLGIKQNKAYTDHPEQLLPPSDSETGTKADPEWNQSGSKVEPQNSIDLGIDKNREDRVIPLNSSCSEQNPEFITLALKDGTNHVIVPDYISNMQQLFPDVNVRKEFRKMSAWCINNPSRRKTARGVGRFINSWLSSAQKEAEEKAEKAGKKTNNIFLEIAEERHEY